MAWGVAAALPLAAHAQTIQQVAAAPAASANQQVVQSQAAIESEPVDAGVPTLPLRHAGIVPGSERLLMNGELLVSGADYTMDYPSGLVYLMRQVPPGATLNATYRYSNDPKMLAGGGQGFAPSSFQFGFLPQGVSLKLGFGLAERGADGQVSRSNLYGLNTNYALGAHGMSALSGMMLFDDRQNVRGMGMDDQGAAGPQQMQTKSHMIVEGLTSKLMGGSMNLNLQDISKSFTSFGSAADTMGAKVGQLQKEAGLKRFGLGMSDVSIGGLKLSNDFHEVQDGSSKIDWRSFGIKQGGLTLGFDSQSVDGAFNRFSDLAEANRADLAREAGTRRTSENFGYATKTASLTATQLDIADVGGGHISQQSADVKLGKSEFTYGDSHVGAAFSAFNNLLDPEKAQFGTSLGVRRNWFTGAFALDGKGSAAHLASTTVKSDLGTMRAQSYGVAEKNFKLDAGSTASDSAFASFGSLTQAETDANIAAVAAMYPGIAVNVPNERGAFTLGAGVSRDFVAGSATPFKDGSLSFSRLNLKDAVDGGSLENAAAKLGRLSGNVRFEDMGPKWDRAGSLMSFEEAAWGQVPGLKQTTWNLADDLGHTRLLNLTQMSADSPHGGAGRSEYDYKDRLTAFSYQSRDVDPLFTNVGQLVDPQAGVLASLVGTRQADTKIDWNPFAGLKYDGEYTSSGNASTKVSTLVDATSLAFDTKTTSLLYKDSLQHSNDPLSLLMAQGQQTVSVKQQVGALTVHAEHDNVDFDGTTQVDATGKPLPDYKNDVYGAAVMVSKTTSLASELTSTQFSDGESASIRTDSVTTQLTPKAGITLSNSTVENAAENKVDESKRNYGFWYDIAKGLRLSYGYVRDLDGIENSTLSSMFTVGNAPANTNSTNLAGIQQGNLGDLALGGGYGVNQWETPDTATGLASTRTQASSNIRINTVKPIKFGILQNLKFQVATDTASDAFQWIRQSVDGGFSGKLGPVGFGMEYRDQVTGLDQRAADRTYVLSSDPDPKRFVTGTFSYKVRTLPDQPSVMIRNYNLQLHPTNRITLSNELTTNPEVANASVVLGSVTTNTSVNRYKLDYKSTKDFSIGASWEELRNDLVKSYGQTTSLDMTLFGSTSPLVVSYGWQVLDGATPRQTIQRWSVKYDQKAGPHQTFNFLIGSLSYGFALPTAQQLHTLTAQVGYQIQL